MHKVYARIAWEGGEYIQRFEPDRLVASESPLFRVG
jgi:hypothetical protein